jgi:hypothetical protein
MTMNASLPDGMMEAEVSGSIARINPHSIDSRRVSIYRKILQLDSLALFAGLPESHRV